jgi:aryl-alcohol dehydrogenase-like predicted oxidoreductase
LLLLKMDEPAKKGILKPVLSNIRPSRPVQLEFPVAMCHVTLKADTRLSTHKDAYDGERFFAMLLPKLRKSQRTKEKGKEHKTVSADPIQMTLFGHTDQNVTVVGLGGEGILRTYGRLAEARKVIREAVAQGITYFDSAHVYADSEVYYGSIWPELPDVRPTIFQASKSASRDAEGASLDLESTLERMGIDYLDLWQIHDVRTKQDLRVISGPGGALEAFVGAKSSGKVRYIGVTGHHDPAILTRAVQDWPVDAVMMPVNPAEGVLGGFLTSTLPAAKAKKIAVIGMKILGASHYVRVDLAITAQLLIRYALSHEITVAIVGCSTVDEVMTLADAGRDRLPMGDEEKLKLLQKFDPYARQLAFYRGVV